MPADRLLLVALGIVAGAIAFAVGCGLAVALIAVLDRLTAGMLR